MSRLRTALVLTVVFASSTSLAMSIHSEETPIAKSDDGATTLIQVDSYGPEGGGSLVYKLKSARGEESFVISSNFSPGDGSRPQAISEKACVEALTQLGAKTASWKAHVVVHPEACGAKGRSAPVTVGKS
ncbi:MAG: hypothetical protein JST54_21430 [Deltaproteobacteria bacterium]|nr:hypothetical protein [Deltaproteobacteria bacterium]